MPTTFASRAVIDQHETDRDVEELIGLFLADWFDGNTHSIGTDPALADLDFPEATLHFGVTKLPDGSMGKAQIHTIIQDNRPDRMCRTSDSARTIERDLLIAQLIRSAHDGNNENRARFLARRTADLVRLLLEHEALDLARKGFLRLTVERGPIEIPMVGYAVYQLVWSARIRLSQTVGTVG